MQNPENKNKLIIVFLFVLFFITSIYYQKNGTYRQVVYDQGQYLGYSKMLVSTLPEILQPNYTSSEKSRIKYFKKKYNIQISYQGFGYPAYLAFIQVITHSSSLDVLRGSQIVLNLLTLYLLLLILSLLKKSQNLSVWLAVMFVAYMPLTYMGTSLLSENLALFFIVLIVYMTLKLYYNSSFAKSIVLTGSIAIALNLLFFTRPVYFYFSLLYLCLIFIIIFQKNFTQRVKFALTVSATILFLLPYIIWINILNNYIKSNNFVWSTTGERKINHSLNESYWLDIDGFPAAKIGNERERYGRPVKESITEDPMGTILLRFEKLYRLWDNPSIIYSNPLIGSSHNVTNIYHLLLLLLAFLGFFILKRWLVRFIVALPILYTTAVYTLYFSEEHRFVYPVMPLVILLALLAVDHLQKAYKKMDISDKKILFKTVILLGIGLLLFNYPFNDLYKPWYGKTAHFLLLGAGLVMILFAFICLLSKFTPRLLKNKIFLFFTLVILASIIIHHIKYTRWFIWSLPLDAPITKAFDLSCINREQIKHAYLQLDLTGDIDKNLVVKANGVVLERKNIYGKYDEVANYEQYPIKTINRKQRKIDDYWNLKQWRVYTIDPKHLLTNKELHISITTVSNNGKPSNLNIYGSYLTNDLKYCGPRLSHAGMAVDPDNAKNIKRRCSLWKYQTDGDIRLYGCQDLMNCNINKNSKQRFYNIRLQLFTNRDEIVF